MKKSLLIISCSKTKTKDPELIPACERYREGQVYLSLHKAMRECRFPKTIDILIISAKYGLLEWEEKIKCYNEKMKPQRAKELRPSIQEKLEAFLEETNYDQLFINLGKTYRKTLEGFDFEKYIKKVVEPKDPRGNGDMNRDMNKWINELYRKEQL